MLLNDSNLSRMSPNPGSGGSPTVIGAREKLGSMCGLEKLRPGQRERGGGERAAATLHVREYANYTLHVYICIHT